MLEKPGYPVGEVLAVLPDSYLHHPIYPKKAQYLHAHRIHVWYTCIYHKNEPNGGKFAIPFAIINVDPMGKRF